MTSSSSSKSSGSSSDSTTDSNSTLTSSQPVQIPSATSTSTSTSTFNPSTSNDSILTIDPIDPSSSSSSSNSSGSTPSSLTNESTIANFQIKYISAQAASDLDSHLMSPPPQGCGYQLEQLMELAGLACAQALFNVYPTNTFKNVLVACGPGNQGGDGLVAARHLRLWGYEVAVWYPKPGNKDFFKSLVSQLEAFDVPIVPEDDFEDAIGTADVLLDAIFGFSFKGPVREPFVNALDLLASESRFEFESRRVRPPIVSVDIPSSWDVDLGNTLNAFTPEVLISLSAAKKGVKEFKGKHFIGGRFIPPSVITKFDLGIPRYLGDSQIVDVTGCKEAPDEITSTGDVGVGLSLISGIGSQALDENKRQEENEFLMKKLNIKGESGMTDKEKEIVEKLTDVTTPTAMD